MPERSVKKLVQKLADQDLKQLESLVRAEVRRRKQIALANAGWTSGEGLKDVLEASLKFNEGQRWLIYVTQQDGQWVPSQDYPKTFESKESADNFIQSCIPRGLRDLYKPMQVLS